MYWFMAVYIIVMVISLRLMYTVDLIVIILSLTSIVIKKQAKMLQKMTSYLSLQVLLSHFSS